MPDPSEKFRNQEAAKILSIDIDPNSIEAATYLCKTYADDKRWEIKEDLFSKQNSWNHLEHTRSYWQQSS